MHANDTRSSENLSQCHSLAEASFESKRGMYQEVILELYEVTEGCMRELSMSEVQMRRMILVELLQATSEDEQHLTTLTLDDVGEIVHHVRLCHETQTPVQWAMIQDIVFPLSTSATTGTSTSEVSSKDAEKLDDSIELSHEPANWCLKALSGERGTREFRERFALTEADLNTVLDHINGCKASETAIRWDLIGEVLFPGDKQRTDIMAASASCLDIDEDLAHYSTGRMTKSASNLDYFHSPSQHRSP